MDDVDVLLRRLVIAGAVFAVSTCSLIALSCAPPPLPIGVPTVVDAALEVGFADLDGFVDVVGRLGSAGVVAVDAGRLSRSGLEAAGVSAPVVVAVRPGGGTVITAALVDAAKLQAALALASGPSGLHLERRLGSVDALVDAENNVVALVRGGDGIVVVVLHPADPWAEAGLAEALATGTLPGPRRTPAAIDVRAQPPPAWLSAVQGPILGALRKDGDAFIVDARVSLLPPGRPVWRALSAAAPSSACAVEEGAVLSVRLPPVPGLDDELAGVVGDVANFDAFEGRVVFGVHAPAAGTVADRDDLASLGSLVVAATPSMAGRAALQQTLTEAFAGAGVVRQVGSRAVTTVTNVKRPWRSLAVVADADVFALGIGSVVPVDRVAVGMTCPSTPGRLLSMNGPGVVALIERADPGVAVMRRLARATGVAIDDPLTALAGLLTLDVDAIPVSGSEAIDVRFRIQLGNRK
jgi:hypothetical protein